MPGYAIQRLSSGSFERLAAEKCSECGGGGSLTEPERDSGSPQHWYRSGATFQGHVEDYKKTGHGIFSWPNGARYEGGYANNRRNGKGRQVWPDGSEYEGEFVDDLRHGHGQHRWANGESYVGSFFHDRRHGAGAYSWPNDVSFTGTFYMDRKEGYGKFVAANGDVFEGLYCDDIRCGPGVLSYTDGTQDVGLWYQTKLIRLCTSVPGAFSVSQHPEFDHDPSQHVTYLEDIEESSKTKNMSNVFDVEDKDVMNKLVHFYNDTLDSRSLAVNKKIFDDEFYRERNNNAKVVVQGSKVKAWNKTPFLVEAQRHIVRHQFKQNTPSFNVAKIVSGDRSSHKPRGPLELASEKLLAASMSGDQQMVKDLLDEGQVHVNVGDKNGHTPLIGAAVNWHIPIINTLLDYGANVNQLSDEGCSALAALCVYYYPVSSFRFNIAEKQVKKPENIFVDASDELCEENENPDGIISASISEEIVLPDLNVNISPRVVKSTCDSKMSKASADSGFPDSAKRSELSRSYSLNPSRMMTSAKLSPLSAKVTQREVSKRRALDDDKDSAVGSDDETASACLPLSPEEFESRSSVPNYPIEVSDSLLERCATNLSQNEQVVSGRKSRDASSAAEGKARLMAIQISERELMKKTLDLLLRRGANPSVSSVPMPVLFFAIKAADVEVVETLLEKGADTAAKLTPEKGGLSPLHIAAAIPGPEGVEITRLLLSVQSEPDVRAAEDDTFKNTTLEEEWSKDVIDESQLAVLGGRTPLHIACARDDNYKQACQVVRLLLDHGANPNLLCNGFSPLTLAIASGNDMAIDELLNSGADPSLRLTHGVGSALCVATSTEYEHRRTIGQRIALIDKLVRAGADILSSILIGPKRLPGTAVDYAYYMFNQDRVIAHMPYHALTHSERETYNARRRLLMHVGDTLRRKAVEREKLRRERDSSTEDRTTPSSSTRSGHQGDSRVTFKSVGNSDQLSTNSREGRKPLLKYCYECGRSVGVRLTLCTRCREVYYCSKVCKLKAWASRHKDECVRIASRVGSPKARRRSASPASKTNQAGKKSGKPEPISVHSLTKDKKALKITVPVKGRSLSAKVVRKRVFVDREGNRVSSADAAKMSDIFEVYMDNYSFV